MSNKRIDQAIELFDKKGASCSQATLAVFDKEVNISKETLLKLASPHGGGVGRLGGMCGALAGAVMAYGLLKGDPYWNSNEEKEAYYANVRDFVKEFENMCGAVNCPALLEKSKDAAYTDRFNDTSYEAARPCSHIVAFAVKMVEKLL